MVETKVFEFETAKIGRMNLAKTLAALRCSLGAILLAAFVLAPF